ncbi:MAG: MATE family efflux transporter [Ruminococcaceae bacterium]|nr:MATE family efflux transporter [Oscillospiraceae bacterium]
MTTTLSSPSVRRDFWRRWAVLLLTVAGQNIIVYGVNLADNIMIGRLGAAAEMAISAVFIVNQIQFLLQMILNGVADGTVVICSRYWGEKNLADIKKAASAALRTGLIISAVMLAAVQIFPRPILSIFTDKPAVIDEAVRYIRIVSFSYVFFAATQVLLGMLRSVECAMVGFVDSCAALVVNLVLNYGLIFGHFGLPAMGIRGAAIATLVSRIVELSIVVLYLAFLDRRLRVKPAELFRTDREITGKFFKVALPVMASGTSWGIAMAIQTAFLGHLEESVITANSIASTLFQVVSVFIYGSATASSVMIGKTMGEGRDDPDGLKKEIRHRAGWMQILFLCLGAATGLILFSSRGLILGFYDIGPETERLARQFMAVLSVTVVGTAYQMACLTGIVRGGGDTKFVFINDLIFMWGIILPTSYLAAFVFQFPPVVIFACLKADQILKCFVAVVKVNRYGWMKKI